MGFKNSPRRQFYAVTAEGIRMTLSISAQNPSQRWKAERLFDTEEK
jgi:hypothetical protein